MRLAAPPAGHRHGNYVIDNDGSYMAGHYQLRNPYVGRFYYIWPPLIRDGMHGERYTDMFNCPSTIEDYHWKFTIRTDTFWTEPGTETLRFKYFEGEFPIRALQFFTYGFNEFGVQHFFDIPAGQRAFGLGGHQDHPTIGGINESIIVQPSHFLAITDANVDGANDTSVSPRLTSPDAQWDDVPSKRHAGGSVALYTDGHAERKSFNDLTDRTPQARRQWNYDHEAHEEWWEPPVNP